MKAWGSDLFLLSTVIRYMLGKPGDLSFFEREREFGWKHTVPCFCLSQFGAPPVGPTPLTLCIDFSRWDFPSEIRAVGAIHCLGT